MRAFTLCLTFSLVVSFSNIPLSAQTEQTPTNLTWLNLGWGGGSYRANSADAALLEAAHQRGAHLFSLRFLPMYNSDIWLGEGGWDLGVLYGRAHHSRDYHAAMSAGPSLMGNNGTRTSGLALSAQIIWTPVRFFGLGLYSYANINNVDSFYGAMLALRFGKLR